MAPGALGLGVSCWVWLCVANKLWWSYKVWLRIPTLGFRCALASGRIEILGFMQCMARIAFLGCILRRASQVFFGVHDSHGSGSHSSCGGHSIDGCRTQSLEFTSLLALCRNCFLGVSSALAAHFSLRVQGISGSHTYHGVHTMLGSRSHSLRGVLCRYGLWSQHQYGVQVGCGLRSQIQYGGHSLDGLWGRILLMGVIHFMATGRRSLVEFTFLLACGRSISMGYSRDLACGRK